jgi:PAS domain-containing protein
MIEDGSDAPPLEERFLRLDGSPVDVEVTATPFDTPGGRARQVLIRDITERKRTEEALRQRTLELDTYFDNALDLLCIADTDGHFHRLNKEWSRRHFRREPWGRPF